MSERQRGVNQVADLDAQRERPLVQPMEPGTDRAAALGAVRIAAEEARFDARRQISRVVHRHSRERTAMRVLRWIRKRLGRSLRQDQIRISLLQRWQDLEQT